MSKWPTEKLNLSRRRRGRARRVSRRPRRRPRERLPCGRRRRPPHLPQEAAAAAHPPPRSRRAVVVDAVAHAAFPGVRAGGRASDSLVAVGGVLHTYLRKPRQRRTPPRVRAEPSSSTRSRTPRFQAPRSDGPGREAHAQRLGLRLRVREQYHVRDAAPPRVHHIGHLGRAAFLFESNVASAAVVQRLLHSPVRRESAVFQLSAAFAASDFSTASASTAALAAVPTAGLTASKPSGNNFAGRGGSCGARRLSRQSLWVRFRQLPSPR